MTLFCQTNVNEMYPRKQFRKKNNATKLFLSFFVYMLFSHYENYICCSLGVCLVCTRYKVQTNVNCYNMYHILTTTAPVYLDVTCYILVLSLKVNSIRVVTQTETHYIYMSNF